MVYAVYIIVAIHLDMCVCDCMFMYECVYDNIINFDKGIIHGDMLYVEGSVIILLSDVCFLYCNIYFIHSLNSFVSYFVTIYRVICFLHALINILIYKMICQNA